MKKLLKAIMAFALVSVFFLPEIHAEENGLEFTEENLIKKADFPELEGESEENQEEENLIKEADFPELEGENKDNTENLKDKGNQEIKHSASWCPISRNLSDKGVKSKKSLVNFFMDFNPDAKKSQVKKMASYYIKEAKKEGINSDCAFVQMCLETGFLKFGGLVTAEMNNFCGLGSTGPGEKGESFKNARMGVRAHIQHLHAYATTEEKELKNKCIDRRYKFVSPRGKAKTIQELAGKWASDIHYGEKLDDLLTRLEEY